MTTMRKLGVALAVLVALLFAGTLYYFMPRATKVLVTGTEVKRMDTKDPASGEHRSRDVRFIYATEQKSKDALVFRNEDNGWYFKFDSGDIAAEASKLAKNEVEETALLKYYGIRIAVLDSYPNVLSLKEVEPDYVYVPWVNMVVLVVLLILFIWAGVKVRRLFSTAKAKLSKRPDAS
ncbi:MAG: DUF1523 family protein [Deltaproteobacteria bacterium]|nr:DUF1523 family protein [Deltaproteobacteria bacterium]